MDISIVVNKPVLKGNTEPVASMWSKWNPETLKTEKSSELTPLSTQKNIRKTLGESVKKYSLAKGELIAKQQIYFENEERRSQEKHDAEQLGA